MPNSKPRAHQSDTPNPPDFRRMLRLPRSRRKRPVHLRCGARGGFTTSRRWRTTLRASTAGAVAAKKPRPRRGQPVWAGGCQQCQPCTDARGRRSDPPPHGAPSGVDRPRPTTREKRGAAELPGEDLQGTGVVPAADRTPGRGRPARACRRHTVRGPTRPSPGISAVEPVRQSHPAPDRRPRRVVTRSSDRRPALSTIHRSAHRRSRLGGARTADRSPHRPAHRPDRRGARSGHRPGALRHRRPPAHPSARLRSAGARSIRVIGRVNGGDRPRTHPARLTLGERQTRKRRQRCG